MSLYCVTCVIVVCSWPSLIVLRARLRLLPPHLLDAGPSVPPSLRAPAKERCRLHQRTSPLHSTTAHQRFRSRGRLSMRWRCPAVCRDTLPSSGGCVACVACESVCIVHSCVNRSCELEQHSQHRVILSSPTHRRAAPTTAASRRTPFFSTQPWIAT